MVVCVVSVQVGAMQAPLVQVWFVGQSVFVVQLVQDPNLHILPWVQVNGVPVFLHSVVPLVHVPPIQVSGPHIYSVCVRVCVLFVQIVCVVVVCCHVQVGGVMQAPNLHTLSLVQVVVCSGVVSIHLYSPFVQLPSIQSVGPHCSCVCCFVVVLF